MNQMKSTPMKSTRLGIFRKLYQLKYRIFKPRLKAKYQFGSPILSIYRWEDYIVVATKLDIFITEDGVNYVRAKKEF